MKKIVATDHAPAAIGPFSQAIRSGSMLFCAGQIPLDPQSGQIVSDDVAAQTKQVLENVSGILQAAGLNFSHVVKSTVILISMEHFHRVNANYGTYLRDT